MLLLSSLMKTLLQQVVNLRDVGCVQLEFPLSLGPHVKRHADYEHQNYRHADARCYAGRFEHHLSSGSC